MVVTRISLINRICVMQLKPIPPDDNQNKGYAYRILQTLAIDDVMFSPSMCVRTTIERLVTLFPLRAKHTLFHNC